MEATRAFAGIDWSWQHHAVCVIDEQGRRLEEVTVAHSAAGLRQIDLLLTRRAVDKVGIERADGPVVEYLLSHDQQVVVISPRQVRSLRARYGAAGNKDDRFDAFVLADALRTDEKASSGLDRRDARFLESCPNPSTLPRAEGSRGARRARRPRCRRRR